MGFHVAALFLPDETATARLGEDLAAALCPGDVILLKGALGAGKTTLARGLIRALADDPGLDVPSPTFTLVQSYASRIPVHHFDLYRLSGPDELEELGLDEALETGVAIVEWPERASGSLPQDAITIDIAEEGAGRAVRIGGPHSALSRIERSLAIRAFLERTGRGEASRRFLIGDASTRAYETVAHAGEAPRILMNAPRQPDGPPLRGGKPYSQIAHLAESVMPFVAIANLLRSEGFSAPEIFEQDLDKGLLLIEHLGPCGFLSAEGSPVPERYEAAARLLAELHPRKLPREIEAAPGVVHRIPDYDRDAMAIEVELLLDWYLPFATGKPVTEEDRAAFRMAWNEVFDRLAAAETSLVLRDFHSPNIIWREDREGLDRLGLIDFQDAMIGPAAYDVASLAQDARVDIPPELEAVTLAAYCTMRASAGDFDEEAFEEAYAIMATQRNSKILGIFVRLDRRDRKPQYLKHLPRIRRYLARTLSHPALSPLRGIYAKAGLIGQEKQ